MESRKHEKAERWFHGVAGSICNRTRDMIAEWSERLPPTVHAGDVIRIVDPQEGHDRACYSRHGVEEVEGGRGRHWA